MREQDRGLTVIPTVYWGEENTYDFCFDGLPENSTLSIYTMNWNAELEMNVKKLDDMITDDLTSVDPTANSLAKRTEGGQLKTNDPIEDNDSINLKYFNSCRISEEDIDSLFGGN